MKYDYTSITFLLNFQNYYVAHINALLTHYGVQNEHFCPYFFLFLAKSCLNRRYSSTTIFVVVIGNSTTSWIDALRLCSSSIFMLCNTIHVVIISCSTSFLQRRYGPAIIAKLRMHVQYFFGMILILSQNISSFGNEDHE